MSAPLELVACRGKRSGLFIEGRGSLATGD
jgi:hypothetical protein